MIKKCAPIEIVENLRSGKGKAFIQKILSGQDRLEGVNFLGLITLEPGSSIGFHLHHGEGEIYYLLTGKGRFYITETDFVEVGEGDLTYIMPESGHGIMNDSQDKLTLLAIVYKKIYIEG